MAKKTEEAGMKTYLLTLKNNGGTRRVTVPSHWKMTFGLTAPYAAKGVGYNQGLALRFYEGSEKNLRAVFTDVEAVRDASIDIMERRTSTQRKVVQKYTAQGAKDVVVEARVTEWVDPDADDVDEPNEFAEALRPTMAALMAGSDDEEV